MADELPPPLVQPQQPPKPRLNLHEIRNSDLVSRLLAATPPYLYSSPVGPHNFFFSDMLRSLVQARNSGDQTNNVRSINNQVPSSGMQSQPGRRPRKRAWSQQRTPLFEPSTKEYKTSTTEKLLPPEKPLELTTKIPQFQIPKYQKCSSPGKPTQQQDAISIKNHGLDNLELKPMTDYSSSMDHSSTNHSSQSLPPVENATLTTGVPSSDLVLPPPPPMWYPPLYPPYGIDPLHFFIDLRVSGHIYDRKKENISPTANDNNNSTTATGIALDLESQAIGKHRHGSAFSVPPPRREKSPSSSALNLTSSSSPDLKPINSYNHTYDHSNQSNAKIDCLSKNTNYVLQNLPRIYTHLSSQNTMSEEPANSQNSEDIDSKSDFDVHDHDRDDDDSNDVVIVDSGKNSKNY